MLNKVSKGHCPEYFTSHLKHVTSTHGYRTRSALCNDVLTPSCKRNSGLRTFHLSASCLWNNLSDTYGNIIFIKENSSQEHLRLVGLFIFMINSNHLVGSVIISRIGKIYVFVFCFY